jgi:FKBP-type peptidyl-prolyl cis-trans isomerase FklB
MKRQIFTILGLGLVTCAVWAQDQKSAPKPTPNAAPTLGQKAEEKTDFSKIFKNDKEKLSYSIGMWAGGNLKRQLKQDEIDIDTDVMIKAFKDNFGSGTTQITETQMREVLTDLTKDLRAKQVEKQKEMAEKQKELGEKNKKDGEVFLAANKTKPGVKAFDSGLQYQVLTEGAGEIPKPSDTVSVNYRGTLIDGSEFDSSKPGAPVSFPVTGVIPGWTEALQHMKAGSKWKLFIPSNLAYGERGHGVKLPPNSTLIFDVELVSVKSLSAPAPTAAVASPAAVASATPPLTSDIIKVPSADELKKGAKIETIKAEDIEKEKAKSSNN